MKGLMLGVAFGLASANTCPGSKSFIHASCQVTATAPISCEAVMAEMKARVDGQATGAWHDPHNNGSYTQTSSGPDTLGFERLTGNKKYTDKLLFEFVDQGRSCQISGCSESQVFSIADFSTNYCNMRMLYCGSKDGCKPVKYDFDVKEDKVEPSKGAGEDASACLKTSQAEHFLAAAASAATCPPAGFETVKDFDLEKFIEKRWYVQQQMPVNYLPKSQNRCVYAEYALRSPKSFWGYDVSVHNHAEDVAAPHAVHDSGKTLCAKVVDKSRGKLEVAPCFLPSVLAGPYWVLDYDEAEGYALISGGAPTESAEGGCRTGTGTNGAGLWIFTRQQLKDKALVEKVRKIAQEKGFDLSVLNDVDQSSCGSEGPALLAV